MNRSDLQEISRIRIREARTLLRFGLYHGAFYLTGYAVECAIKACICNQTKRFDFPDKKLASRAWVHNLEELMGLAGLTPELVRAIKSDQRFDLNWAVAKDWSEDSRYDSRTTALQAQNLYSACTARKSGILPWIRKRWSRVH